MLKNRLIPPLILTFLFASSLVAQQTVESITSSTEKEKSKYQFFQYLDINQYEQTFIFKINHIVNTNSSISFSNSTNAVSLINVEKKIFPSLSVEGQLLPLTDFENRNYMEFIAGLRFYPSKRENSKAEKNTINNFNGNYLRVAYSKGITNKGDLFSANNFFISGGIQQRLDKFFYFDASISLGYNSYTQSFRLAAGIGMGLAFGKTKLPEDYDPSIIVRENPNPIWNRVIFGLTNPDLFITNDFYTVGIAAMAELLIGNYLTFRPKIIYRNLTFNNFFSSDDFNANIMYLNLEARKYVNIKKSYEKGIALKSFSGPYLGFKLSELATIANVSESDYPTTSAVYFNPGISAGYQSRIEKRGLFEINNDVVYNSRTEKLIYRFQVSLGLLIAN